MELYTVDRAGSLATGMECSLVEHDDIAPPEIARLVREYCPGGVSRHGDLYLVTTPQDTTVTDANTEMLFELVRRCKYPDKPSRYQSLFAVGNLETASTFIARYGAHNHRVFRIDPAVAFRADMRLLDARMSVAVKAHFAELYWQGLPHPDPEPFWEWLVPCPVVIGEQVR